MDGNGGKIPLLLSQLAVEYIRLLPIVAEKGTKVAADFPKLLRVCS